MKKLAAALIGGSFLAAPAFAGGLAQPEPEPVVAAPVIVEPMRADGDWGGFYAGAHLGYGKADDDAGVAQGSGALGGAQLGYRWDLGTAVLGVEGDYSASSVDFDDDAGKLDSIARLKLQAGYDMGNTLVYATAGAAKAKADIGGVDMSDTGYFGGVGVDYKLTDAWTVGGEVLMHKFDDFDSTGNDIDTTTAAVRVNYNF